jgi:hypothetical protein
MCMALAALAAAACGGGGGGGDGAPPWPDEGGAQGDVIAVIASSQLVVGENRFLLALLDSQNNVLTKPDLTVHMGFYNLGRSRTEPVTEVDGRFIWAIPGVRGLDVARVTFDEAGTWGIDVTATPPKGEPIRARALFTVLERGTTPAIGDPAPASDTKTLADVPDIEQLTSDEQPDERLYRLSVKDALAEGKPFVVAFTTPAFCTSAVCGPTLDVVKEVMPGYLPDVNFIHVEVYDLSKPGELVTVPAIQEWGLPSEPWVFVVDANGNVAAKFEGALDASELREALDAVTGAASG